VRSEIESDIISFKNNAALVAGQSDATMSTVNYDDKYHVVVGGIPTSAKNSRFTTLWGVS
jgi:hypothetical protein